MHHTGATSSEVWGSGLAVEAEDNAAPTWCTPAMPGSDATVGGPGRRWRTNPICTVISPNSAAVIVRSAPMIAMRICDQVEEGPASPLSIARVTATFLIQNLVSYKIRLQCHLCGTHDTNAWLSKNWQAQLHSPTFSGSEVKLLS